MSIKLLTKIIKNLYNLYIIIYIYIHEGGINK